LQHVESSRLTDDWYRVIGGEHAEGAVIVSQFDSPVDYSSMLSGRVANVVPVDSIDRVTDAVNAYTQTIGIYPESLKRELRNVLPLFGAQRLTSLGYACNVSMAMPQDAIEPIRRMCRWIVDEECDPDVVIRCGGWQRRAGFLGSDMSTRRSALEIVDGLDLGGATCVVTGATAGWGVSQHEHWPPPVLA